MVKRKRIGLLLVAVSRFSSTAINFCLFTMSAFCQSRRAPPANNPNKQGSDNVVYVNLRLTFRTSAVDYPGISPGGKSLRRWAIASESVDEHHPQHMVDSGARRVDYRKRFSPLTLMSCGSQPLRAVALWLTKSGVVDF